MPKHLSRYYGFLISDSPPLQNLRLMSDHTCYFPSGSERQDFRLSGNGWEGQYPWPGPVTSVLYTNFVFPLIGNESISEPYSESVSGSSTNIYTQSFDLFQCVYAVLQY